MNKLHTPDQFTSPVSLIGIGVIGLVLGVMLVVRAFDTGSWWQYLGVVLLFTLSVRLFKRASNSKNK